MQIPFCSAGYVALFTNEDDRAVNISHEWINCFEGSEARKQMFETLRDYSAVYAKKCELAAQSFLVVFWALLGCSTKN